MHAVEHAKKLLKVETFNINYMNEETFPSALFLKNVHIQRFESKVPLVQEKKHFYLFKVFCLHSFLPAKSSLIHCPYIYKGWGCKGVQCNGCDEKAPCKCHILCDFLEGSQYFSFAFVFLVKESLNHMSEQHTWLLVFVRKSASTVMKSDWTAFFSLERVTP